MRTIDLESLKIFRTVVDEGAACVQPTSSIAFNPIRGVVPVPNLSSPKITHVIYGVKKPPLNVCFDHVGWIAKSVH
jgi:hypothetical protein